VSPVCHIPPDKLFECLDNSRMHSNRWQAMALRGI
jgi:hypothetical protein